MKGNSEPATEGLPARFITCIGKDDQGMKDAVLYVTLAILLACVGLGCGGETGKGINSGKDMPVAPPAKKS